MRIAATTILLLCVLAATPSAQARDQRLETGFFDNEVQSLSGEERASWLGRARLAGATTMRVSYAWAAVAPTRPPAASATDPLWDGYQFADLDARIRATQAAGMTVLLSISRAPGWAEGPERTGRNRVGVGSWMPDAQAFGQFMTAVARRYDGSQPGLPRVDRFQVWNEPNLNLYLAPQFDSAGRPVAAVRFRDLLNAGYAAVKSANPSAVVAAAGLAPYGDPGTAGYRSRPVAFLRTTLCLGPDLKASCRQPTSVDAISLHPYAVGAPRQSATNGDDATIPDWKRLTAVLRAARRARTLGPRLPRRWVTEVSYDSSPPDPEGVPTEVRGRYIAQMLWLFADQGVDTVIWYLLRDEAPTPSYAATQQSGMFMRAGDEKPDAIAFRFPMWITDRSRRRLSVWWRSPVDASAKLQIRVAGRWRTVRRVQVQAGRTGSDHVPRRNVHAVRLKLPGGGVSYAVGVR